MEVHPAINCENQDYFENRIAVLASFLDKNDWIHIDISDGAYVEQKSFFDENVLKKYSNLVNFEAHLMVLEDNIYKIKWFSGVFKRIIIHSSVVKDWRHVIELSQKNNIEIGAVVLYDEVDSYIPNDISLVEVLSVNPGLSGQKFKEKAFETVKSFKKNYPHVKIILDGGVNLEIAKRAKEFGVDILVSSSFIWDFENPRKQFELLKNI